MYKKDIDQFSSLFSDFTGIDVEKIKSYLKSHNVTNLIGSPTSITTDKQALDIIDKLKRLRNLYDNLKSYDNEYVLSSPEMAHNFFKNNLKDFNDREYFAVLFLNTKNRVIDFSIVSEGSINTALVVPREIFKLALLKNAAAILVGHNHPSHIVTPSDEDRAITERLVLTGSVMGVNVIDSVIIGGENLYSFRANGGIPSSIDSKTLDDYFKRFENQKTHKFAILQLSRDDNNRYRKFTDLDALKKFENEAPNVLNYELIYAKDSSIPLSELDLPKIYHSLNSGTERPSSYYGHSLSVSDVIVISDGENHDAYFVDSFGFQKLDGFLSNSMVEKIVKSMDIRKEYDFLMNNLNVDSKNPNMLERFSWIEKNYSGVFEFIDKRVNRTQWENEVADSLLEDDEEDEMEL